MRDYFNKQNKYIKLICFIPFYAIILIIKLFGIALIIMRTCVKYVVEAFPYYGI